MAKERRYLGAVLSQECFWLLVTLLIGHLLLLSRKSQNSGPRVGPETHQSPLRTPSSVQEQYLLIATRWLLQLPESCSHRTASLAERREERGKKKSFCFACLPLINTLQCYPLTPLHLIGQNMTILKPVTIEGERGPHNGLRLILVQSLRLGTLPLTFMVPPLTFTWPCP